VVYLSSSGVAAATTNTDLVWDNTNKRLGVGRSTPSYKIDTSGYINAPNVQKTWTINLTNTTTYPVARFFPVVIDLADTIQTGLYRHRFSVDMPSQSGAVAYNDHWIQGWVQAGGWSDQQPRMFQLAHGYYDGNERSILGVYVGNTLALTQVVVYLRGGGTYYIKTDSTSVVAYSSAYSVTDGTNTNTFAVKDANGTDVVGTSLGIAQLFYGTTSSVGTYTSGVNVVQNINSTYGTPATTGSFASDATVLDRINGGDVVLDTGVTTGGPVWIQARRLSNFADKFSLLLNPNGGNVGIGTTSPGYPLDVAGAMRLNGNYTYVGGSSGSTSSTWAFDHIDTSSTFKSIIFGYANSNGNAAEIGFNYSSSGSTSNFVDIGFYGFRPFAITYGGNVGIGTSSPQCPLHVYKAGGTSSIRGEIRVCSDDGNKSRVGMYEEAAGSTWGCWMQYNGTGDLFEFGSKRNGTDTSPQMTITSAGRVGIGTTAPEAPLHVTNQNLSFYFPSGYYAFYNGGYTGIGGPFTATVQICAYFSGGRIVVGGEMDALSDRRKKTDIKTLESALDDIRKVRIATYKMIDDGSQEYGVIAQELDEVYPLMVKKNGVEFLPTSDCPAMIIQVTDELVGITFDTFTDITVDDKVRIVLENNTKQELKVERVTTSGIYFKKWENFDETQKIYVYGKEHRDVQTVTKNALFMVNIRATQELAEKVDRLEAENKILHARLEALEKLLMKE
jgi:hypothetical protein